MYKLCNRDTGYIYSFTVYEGKDSQLHPPEYIGTSGKVVWELIYPLLGKGYHFMWTIFTLACPCLEIFTGETPQHVAQ